MPSPLCVRRVTDAADASPLMLPFRSERQGSKTRCPPMPTLWALLSPAGPHSLSCHLCARRQDERRDLYDSSKAADMERAVQELKAVRP